jgi:very-short-patch-repair endonuclease
MALMPRYNSNLKEPARHLRKEMTAAEQILWTRLRRKQVMGVQFYRQRPFLRFILDFYAPSVKLVVEVDGDHHQAEPQQWTRDRQRDAILTGSDLRVLRFSNREVQQEIGSVLKQVEEAVGEALAKTSG